MLIFKFTRHNDTEIIPAATLLDAVTALPVQWRLASPHAMTVTSYPATELDYWKGKCHMLERRLQQQLRSH